MASLLTVDPASPRFLIEQLSSMKKIRIGKDIEVRWRILTNGEPLPLAGRDLWLEIVNGYGRQGHEFSIEDGNEVVFTFGGLEQRHPGVHTFTLWENRCKEGQTVVDSCDGVELVRSTCMEGGDGGNVSSETSDLSTESINLSSVNLGTETDSYTKEEADRKFQAKSDQALETEDKTVVGAINEVRAEVESAAPAYELKGLYYAISMNQMHLDDATPYIGSFEELQRAIESGAHIVDYVPAGQDGGESPSVSFIPLMAQFVPDQTITLMYTMGPMVVTIKLIKLLDGVEADADPVSLSSVIRYKSTLQSDYLIPSNPTDTEHLYIITVGPTVYQVTWSGDIKWQDGIPPKVEANTTLVVSVFNNLAVWGTFKEEA